MGIEPTSVSVFLQKICWFACPCTYATPDFRMFAPCYCTQLASSPWNWSSRGNNGLEAARRASASADLRALSYRWRRGRHRRLLYQWKNQFRAL